MLLQKTLHMNQSLDECKHRLASIQSYRRQFVMVTKATVTSSKTVDFSFRGPLGFEARTVLLAVESDSPDQFAFESTGGNVDVMGLVEFTEIRPSCTEVTLALHYEIKNKLFAWLDRRFHFVDAFVNSDADLAEKVIMNDNIVDDLYEQIFRELLTYMLEDPRAISRAIKLIFIAKHLERVGDHSANIAEMVIFLVRGQDIRHGTRLDRGR